LLQNISGQYFELYVRLSVERNIAAVEFQLHFISMMLRVLDYFLLSAALLATAFDLFRSLLDILLADFGDDDAFRRLI